LREKSFIVSTIEISDIVWFDDISNSVIIAFDNITITFTMQEFFHFLSSVKDAETVLMNESIEEKDTKASTDIKTEEVYIVNLPDDDIEN